MEMPPSTGRQEAEAVAQSAQAERYDRVVRLAKAIFGAPIAALNLIGNKSQFTISAAGHPTGEMPIENSFCRVTVQQDDIVEVHDLREDERFSGIPAVFGSQRVRFYAGVPVRGQSGQNIGALCILDVSPRTLDRQQREMLTDLGALLERELAVQEEMDLAGQVQQLMLPTSAPDIAGVEIAGRVQPAREAGGDYFDWFVVNEPHDTGGGTEKRLQIVVGDVMGKGLAASLIASEVRAVLRGHSQYTDVGDAVARTSSTTNHDLEANNRFSTLWVGRLDPSTGAIDYVDAGHGLGIIASQSGYRRLAQDYLPLGLSTECSWLRASDILADDELLIIVSDGVFDVFGDSFEQVEAQLQPVLDPALSCQEIVDRIVAFAVSHETSDDVTAVAARRRRVAIGDSGVVEASDTSGFSSPADTAADSGDVSGRGGVGFGVFLRDTATVGTTEVSSSGVESVTSSGE